MSKREFSFADVRPSRVAKETVSYCDTSDSELEFDEDGYKRPKTKSFNKKANATDSDIDEFELGPDADYKDESITYNTMLSEMELEDEEMIGLKRKKNSEATKPSTAAKSSAVTKSSTAIQSSVGVDKRMTDKEKRATNKKIKEEVLQQNHQFKAVLSVPKAFGPEHWKELISQMKKDGYYTNQLFVDQSRVSQSWRGETLVKARQSWT